MLISADNVLKIDAHVMQIVLAAVLMVLKHTENMQPVKFTLCLNISVFSTQFLSWIYTEKDTGSGANVLA